MNIYVLPKNRFNKLMSDNNINDDNVESKTKVFFISINNDLTESPDTSISYFKENKRNVLILHFDDVEEDLYNKNGKLIARTMTDSQAKDILNFLENQKNIDNVFIHCSAGINRSGSVGSFICDYFNCDYSGFKRINPHIGGNGNVSRLLNNEFRNRLFQ